MPDNSKYEGCWQVMPLRAATHYLLFAPLGVPESEGKRLQALLEPLFKPLGSTLTVVTGMPPLKFYLQ